MWCVHFRLTPHPGGARLAPVGARPTFDHAPRGAATGARPRGSAAMPRDVAGCLGEAGENPALCRNCDASVALAKPDCPAGCVHPPFAPKGRTPTCSIRANPRSPSSDTIRGRRWMRCQHRSRAVAPNANPILMTCSRRSRKLTNPRFIRTLPARRPGYAPRYPWHAIWSFRCERRRGRAASEHPERRSEPRQLALARRRDGPARDAHI